MFGQTAECRPCNFGVNGCFPADSLDPGTLVFGGYQPVYSVQKESTKDALAGGQFPSGGEYELPAEESRYVNLGASVAGSCLVREPETIEGETFYVGGHSGCADPDTTSDVGSCKIGFPLPTAVAFAMPTYISQIAIATPATTVKTGLGAAFGDLSALSTGILSSGAAVELASPPAEL